MNDVCDAIFPWKGSFNVSSKTAEVFTLYKISRTDNFYSMTEYHTLGSFLVINYLLKSGLHFSQHILSEEEETKRPGLNPIFNNNSYNISYYDC